MYVNFNLRFECVNTKPKNCDIILEKQKCKYLMNKLCQKKIYIYSQYHLELVR